jgi:lipid-A-disaccharide synthase
MSPDASASRHLFLSCGEASGDRYGASLIAALRELDPSLRFSALGGPAVAAAGAEIVRSDRELAVMGFVEVVRALPSVLAARRAVWRHLARGSVDLCIPVDFPGFNLQVAAQARRRGVPVYYLVPPQLWAWGGWRVGQLRRHADRVGVILPFEEEFYRRRGIAVTALGHPLMEDYAGFPFERLAEERERSFRDPGAALTLGLLPGSRRQEIQRLLPVMKIAAQMMQSRLQPRALRCVVSAAPGVDAGELMELVAAGFEISKLPLPLLLERLDLAVVCSGTASLEAALAGVPHELVYATSPVNHWFARRLVKIERIGLANLILGEEAIREHVQDDLAPVPLARSLLSWVGDPESRRRFHQRARRLRELCGPPGVWRRAAREIIDFLEERDAVE